LSIYIFLTLLEAMKLSTTFFYVFQCVTLATALSAAEWRKQSIYQVLTDRFARPADSTDDECNISYYCGGTWQGIIDKLDYIQGMGFTAVRIRLTLVFPPFKVKI